jgi:hypothetical protein
MASRFAPWLVISMFAFAALTLGLSCKKSSSDAGPGGEFFVVLGPPDVNTTTGTISDAGLEKIKKAEGQSNLTIRMSGHAAISDAALVQLAQFKNLHKLLAPNSKITPAGIEKLKKAVPGVEVES